MGSNKSIVGVGSSGVIMGRGLQLSGGISNVIIQNILITVQFTSMHLIDMELKGK